MNAAEIEQLLQGIPVQTPVAVLVRSVQEAVAAGDLPPLDVEAGNVFTQENAFCRKMSFNTVPTLVSWKI